ncbi:formate dehydrogenase subunit gamma [Thalassobaculum sp.]|uniref:formate dehydrogenase subunit gamma n=1 Tax=Thalassobaculum sp. TaxID=2022740 RepID=UPI0032F077A9
MVRVIAAIVASALVILLGYTVYLGSVTDDLIVPTNEVAGRKAVDNPSNNAAGRQSIIARTELQRWRAASGPSPEQPRPAAGRPADGALKSPDAPNIPYSEGRAVVNDWLSNRDGESKMLREPQNVSGRSSLPGPAKETFVQPQGRQWRSARNGPIAFGGAFYLIGVAAILAVFLSVRGRVPIKEGLSGQTVSRFSAFERANHWLTAGSFIVLALTGLVILFGKDVIRPWLGPDLFGDLAEGSAWLHMALVAPLAVGVAVMIASWSWQNLPTALDWKWLKQGGGFMRDNAPNPPADRFNAGQKLIFWAVILGSIVLIGTGLAMMFPFLWAGYDGMQLAQSTHAIAALIMIGIIFGHIYIGTIGMVGAFDAIWSGNVDRNWAKEHHSIWYGRLSETADADEQKSTQPAE